MIALLALLLLATPSRSAGAETCPGGPTFGFVRGSDRLDVRTERSLKNYIENLNAPLWRSGWTTVSPLVLGRVDALATRLAERRKATIVRQLKGRGITAGRVRFEVLQAAPPGDADADTYPSTLSTPRAVWEAHVTQGVAC
jgi:hypothetical protein